MRLGEVCTKLASVSFQALFHKLGSYFADFKFGIQFAKASFTEPCLLTVHQSYIVQLVSGRCNLNNMRQLWAFYWHVWARLLHIV